MTASAAPHYTLPASTGAELAHVVVYEAARRVGAAAVFIKGPVANERRIRPPKTYADVDVFLEPSRRNEVLEMLLAHGWRGRPASSAQKTFTTHSTTLIHPDWPADVDVHFTFPGMFASETAIFDALLAHSSEVLVGGQGVLGASTEASLVIAALHALRSRESAAHRFEFDQAVQRVLEWYPVEEERRAALLPFIDAVDAREALRPFLEDVGISISYPFPTSHAYLEWRVQTDQMSRTGNWLLLILRAPLAQRTHLLRQALFPSKSDLLIEHLAGSSPSRSHSFLRVRLSRLWRGLRALPRALTVVREERGNAPRSPGGNAMPSADVELLPRRRLGSEVETPSPRRPPERPGLAIAASPRRGEVEMSGGVALLALDAASLSAPLILRDSGHLIWRHLQTPITREELTSEIAAGYGIPLDAIRADVERFLRDLRDRRLIEEVAA